MGPTPADRLCVGVVSVETLPAWASEENGSQLFFMAIRPLIRVETSGFPLEFGKPRLQRRDLCLGPSLSSSSLEAVSGVTQLVYQY